MDCVLINLTPHAIDVVDPESGGLVASLPPEPEPARAEMERERLGTMWSTAPPSPSPATAWAHPRRCPRRAVPEPLPRRPVSDVRDEARPARG
jgi:hypothetical protein